MEKADKDKPLYIILDSSSYNMDFISAKREDSVKAEFIGEYTEYDTATLYRVTR